MFQEKNDEILIGTAKIVSSCNVKGWDELQNQTCTCNLKMKKR